MNLMQETLSQLKSGPDKTAIIDKDGTSISFKDYYLEVVRTSAFLRRQGINQQSKVLLLVPMDLTLYSTIAALFGLGATIILIDPWAQSDYIENALSQVEPEFIILNKMGRIFFTKKSIRKIKKRIYKEDLLLKDPDNIWEETTSVDNEHSALITFTSGTTGKPKGFDRSHFFLLNQAHAHEKYFMHEKDDIDLTMYPVFVLSNIKSLMTTVLIDGNLKNIDDVSPERIHKQIREHKVNSLSLSPALLEKYITYLEEKKEKLSVEKIFTGGGPVSLPLCKRVLILNEDVKAYIVYGSTEAEPISVISFKEALSYQEEKEKCYPVGKVVDGHRYKLIQENAPLHPFHSHPVCELHLTGNFVGKRYVNNEKAFLETKYKDPEGNIWHKTGDVLIRDENENLFILGRVSDVIQTDKGALYPLLIESYIEKQLELKKCCYTFMDGIYYLVYEGKGDQKEIKDLLKQLEIPCDEVTSLVKIPVDDRHKTKINRKKLQSELKKGNDMISESSPLLKKILAYTNERFPLIPILLFVVLLVLSCANLISTTYGGEALSFKQPILYLTILSVFLFMLQLRLSDEIKDFEKDKIAYPERILSRGLINLKFIETILFSLIGFNILLSFFMGIKFFIFMGLIQIYALLMKEEFFCKTFLEKKIGLYLISHQFILPIICLYAGLTLTELSSISMGPAIIFILLYLSLPSTLYEISRKTWSQDRENSNADSYTKSWGIAKTIWVQMGLLLAITWLCKLVPLNFNIYYLSSFFALNFFILIFLALFKARPTRKNSKLLELTGSLYLLLFHALNAFLLF